MLEYNRIDVSERIDVNKTNDSHECIICQCQYFKVNFRFWPKVCNGCHDFMEKAMHFHDVTVVSVKGNDYRIYFWYMRKDVAINIMKNSDLDKTSRSS